jgi:hypothetical protein
LRRSFCETLRGGGGGIQLYPIGGAAVIGAYMLMFEFILSPVHYSLLPIH